jgi:hypothetical protein
VLLGALCWCCCLQGQIWQSVKWLDELGMKIIEQVGGAGSSVAPSTAGVAAAAAAWWRLCQGLGVAVFAILLTTRILVENPPVQLACILTFMNAVMPCMQRDPAAFTEYLHTYHNTICGRHPISVLLQVRMVG